jgi:hypothetical protein
MFLAFQFVCTKLPWDVEFREQMKFMVRGSQTDQLRMYTRIRIDMFDQFLKQISEQFQKKVPHIALTAQTGVGELPNPFTRISRLLTMLNY